VISRPDPLAPRGLLASWLAGLIALPLTLFVAASGQGIGALLAKAGWIGLSVPWDRQAWALVNQPVLNFASLPAASGYWLGSLIASLTVSALAIGLSLRLQSLGSQLFVVQWAWMAAIIGASWQPALDPHLSHLTRWLLFRGLPAELRWLSLALVVALAVPIALRLIAIARITHYHLRRSRRLVLVAVHLLPFPLAWAAATTALRGGFQLEASIMAGIPLLVALLVAWIGYPAPLTHTVTPMTGRAFGTLVAGLLLAWAVFWVAGRPLPDDRAAAVQWGRDKTSNNIRPWMEPVVAPWLTPTAGPDDSESETKTDSPG
jgi:hypothetical protein